MARHHPETSPPPSHRTPQGNPASRPKTAETTRSPRNPSEKTGKPRKTTQHGGKGAWASLAHGKTTERKSENTRRTHHPENSPRPMDKTASQFHRQSENQKTCFSQFKKNIFSFMAFSCVPLNSKAFPKHHSRKRQKSPGDKGGCKNKKLSSKLIAKTLFSQSITRILSKAVFAQ